MAFRFVHSSDLHIGKRFGNMPEELRGRLAEARHDAIARLAAQAREHGAAAVLLAGDTFDTETPTPSVLRQALAAMGGTAPLRWLILPGNHDSLAADELWSTAESHCPPNVTLALTAAPVELSPGVVVLPAPCTTRRPGRDLTASMDGAATADGALRIGLAHGAAQSFSEDSGASDVIAPDRAKRAGLAYLALGDWHGQMRVGERAWYSGAPEPDRFKHDAPGRALLVTLAGPGAAPEIAPLETGAFRWLAPELPLLAGEDAVAALAALLPSGRARRQTLLAIRARGRIRLADRAALSAAAVAAAPDFAWLSLDESALAGECEGADLDAIDRAGALRQAAEALLAEAADEKLSAASRDVAGGALARLFAFCRETPA